MPNFQNKGISTPVGIFIILLVAIILSGGIYLWQQKTSPAKTLNQNQTADWQTYSNGQYGFELKYPGDWAHSTDVASEYFSKSFNKNSIDFTCSFGVTITDSDYFKNAYPNNKQVNVNIGDISAVKIEGLSGGINYGDYLIKGDEQNNSFEITETIEKIITNKDGQKVAFGTVNDQGCIDTFNQMLSTFKFIGVSKRQIQTGKIDIDNNQVAGLQNAVDAGQQPWRLDIFMAASADLPQYGFAQDDLKTLQCPHIASNWVIGEDITSLPCEISHDDQKYAVIVSQPQPGIGKIWMVSEIELAPFK